MPKQPPEMFAIGSPRWPGLSKITEESGEVQQVIGKLMGTGGEPYHWDGSDLRERLIEEVGDVLAACDFAIEANALDPAQIEARRSHKLQLFRRWHRDTQTATRALGQHGLVVARNPAAPATDEAPPVSPQAEPTEREPLCEKWCGKCKDTYWIYSLTEPEPCPRCNPTPTHAQGGTCLHTTGPCDPTSTESPGG